MLKSMRAGGSKNERERRELRGWLNSCRAERPVSRMLRCLVENLREKHGLKLPRAQEKILIRNTTCFISAGLALEFEKGR